jgi:hypothetical protein
MAVDRFCDRCNRRTSHGDMVGNGGCNVCEEREEREYHTRLREKFKDMTDREKFLHLYDLIQSR